MPTSVFDIIGPVMVGPSSSHTLGAARLGSFAREFASEKIHKAKITLYGSFAETYKGHMTDVAIIGGLIGLRYDDEQLAGAKELAGQMGFDYEIVADNTPYYQGNTAKFELLLDDGSIHTIVADSIGAGLVNINEIDGMYVDISGEYCSLVTVHADVAGMAASITAVLAERAINIAFLKIYREERNKRAMLVAQTDEDINEDILSKIKGIKGVGDAYIVGKLR
ncbi:MAG: L-serine ammonia-lyase, iron-sulfur-dependent subunit beta [Eubacteriaceae bacterium]|nr:L-serine ammonia-lyase, iron-sulfur-dependent subunit beta [Eubacteriaceae bacterium]